MKKFLLIAASLIIACTSFLSVASAQLLVNQNDQITQTVAARANFGSMPIEDIIASVIKIILSFLGIIFLILMTIAGFKWMTAQGNAELVKEAQGTMRAAIIGLIVVLAAYGITYFIFRYVPFSGGGQGMPNPL